MAKVSYLLLELGSLIFVPGGLVGAPDVHLHICSILGVAARHRVPGSYINHLYWFCNTKFVCFLIICVVNIEPPDESAIPTYPQLARLLTQHLEKSLSKKFTGTREMTMMK